MHLESISNGLGAQSMWLVVLAGRREIPATVSITADTGWENDCVWSNGERSTAREYYDSIVVPVCRKLGIASSFVRSELLGKVTMQPLVNHVSEMADKKTGPAVPMFGSKGGRLPQRCTDKWKIRAVRQEARRMGAKTVRFAQGIHFGEADRRVSGKFIGMDGQWSIYRTTVKRDGVEREVKWCSHFYPLVDLKLRREQIQSLVRKEGIPYLVSTQCDGCPHKDLPRWERTAPEVLQNLAALEAKFNGEYFFTSRRIPLLEAIEAMKRDRASKPELFQVEADFGCGNATCGV